MHFILFFLSGSVINSTQFELDNVKVEVGENIESVVTIKWHI